MQLIRMSFAVAVMAAIFSPVGAQEKGAEKPKVVETKGTPRVSATTIDFQKSLGLSFESLATLGGRIEQCRLAADPVGLASAAKELAVAETVSSKKAEVASAALLKEATELAEDANSSQELAALALLAGGKDADWNKLASAAKQAEDDRAAALKSGEEPKGDYHHVHVHNHHAHPVQIYHNGYHAGHVPGYGSWRIPCYGDRNIIYGHGPTTQFHLDPSPHHGHIDWHLHHP